MRLNMRSVIESAMGLVMKHVKKCLVLISVWISKGSPPDKCMKRSRGDWFYSYFRKVTKKPTSGDNTPAPTSSRNSSIHYHNFISLSLQYTSHHSSLNDMMIWFPNPHSPPPHYPTEHCPGPNQDATADVEVPHSGTINPTWYHIRLSLSSLCHHHIPAITHHHHYITTSRYDSPSSSTSSSWISLSRAKCYRQCWEASFRHTIIIISTSYTSWYHLHHPHYLRTNMMIFRGSE